MFWLTRTRSTGHALHRWRSAILCDKGNVESLPVPRSSPSPEPLKDPVGADEPRNPCPEPFLDLNAITIAGTWKDLPQEIVDHIVFVLRNDLKSLKACSLTCKAMFVTTRRLIHRRISLTSERNWEVLTLPEKQRYIREDRQGIAIKVLSTIAAHGLLQYGRHLFVDLNKNFTPDNLQPFNHHFQCFDRIEELNIRWLHAQPFLVQFDTFFANFVPTLRSLHLDTPTGDTRDIMDFICRFPHLDDLTLRMTSEAWMSPPSSPVVKNMPPFRGRLKLHWFVDLHGYMLRQLISLPGKRRFRSLDFRGIEMGQPVIDACSGTIETLSITWARHSEYWFIL